MRAMETRRIIEVHRILPFPSEEKTLGIETTGIWRIEGLLPGATEALCRAKDEIKNGRAQVINVSSVA